MSRYTFSNIDLLLSKLHANKSPIDLGHIEWIEPTALLLLTIFKIANAGVDYNSTTDPKVENYMDFIYSKDNADAKNGIVFQNFTDNIDRISNDICSKLISTIGQKLSNRDKKDLKAYLHYCISEMMTNVKAPCF